MSPLFCPLLKNTEFLLKLLLPSGKLTWRRWTLLKVYIIPIEHVDLPASHVSLLEGTSSYSQDSSALAFLGVFCSLVIIAFSVFSSALSQPRIQQFRLSWSSSANRFNPSHTGLQCFGVLVVINWRLAVCFWNVSESHTENINPPMWRLARSHCKMPLVSEWREKNGVSNLQMIRKRQ